MYILPEQHKVHWFLAHVVKFLQVTLYYMSQLLKVTHLNVMFRVRFWVCKITVDQTTKIILSNFAIIVEIQMDEQLVKILTQFVLTDITGEGEKPVSISVIHETIIVDSEHLHTKIVFADTHFTIHKVNKHLKTIFKNKMLNENRTEMLV